MMLSLKVYQHAQHSHGSSACNCHEIILHILHFLWWWQCVTCSCSFIMCLLKDDFVLETDGNSNTIDKVYISNGKLIINHQTSVTDTKTIVLTYTKNNDATKNLIDLDNINSS